MRRVDSEWVTLQLVAIQSGETTFSQPQDIDLRVDGRWFVVKSGHRTDIDPAREGATARSGDAPDNNTALVRIPRSDDVLSLDARWNLTYDMPTVLLGDANQPALMTFNTIEVSLPQQLSLDPRDFPDSRTLLARELEAAWRELGPLKWLALLLALWLVPNIGLLFNRLALWLWTKAKSKRRSGSDATTSVDA